MEEVIKIMRRVEALITIGVSRVSAGDVYGYVQLGQAEAILGMYRTGLEKEKESD